MVKKKATIQNRARKLELQISLFIVKNNLPFCIADEFVNFIKDLDIDSDVQQALKCRRTRCTALIRRVLGEFSRNCLIESLRVDMFSITIDEATDISITQHLAVCVRHPGPEAFTVRDDFLALLEVSEINIC
jgi:hypothetical protein